MEKLTKPADPQNTIGYPLASLEQDWVAGGKMINSHVGRMHMNIGVERAARSDFKRMLHKGNSKWRISVDEQN